MTGISARIHASKSPPAVFRPKFGRDPSRCGWTPYDGMEVQGRPVGTIIRGRRVMWEGELVTPAQGEPVRFHQAL